MRDDDETAGYSTQNGGTGQSDTMSTPDQDSLAKDGDLTAPVNAENAQGDVVTQPADDEEPAAEEAAAQLGDFA